MPDQVWSGVLLSGCGRLAGHDGSVDVGYVLYIIVKMFFFWRFVAGGMCPNYVLG